MEWDEPGPDFEAFVAETVRNRMGKYTQPDHWARISHDEAQTLAEKVQKTVMDNERKVSDSKPGPSYDSKAGSSYDSEPGPSYDSEPGSSYGLSLPSCPVLSTLHQTAWQP